MSEDATMNAKAKKYQANLNGMMANFGRWSTRHRQAGFGIMSIMTATATATTPLVGIEPSPHPRKDEA